MKTPFFVLARDALSLDPAAAARVIARATGWILLDVLREVRRQVGFLASGLSGDEADRLVGALAGAGIPAFALAENDFVRFPDPRFIETARLGGDALDVSDLRDAEGRRLGAVSLPYRDVVLLVTAQVRKETERRVVESHPSPNATSLFVGTGLFFPPSPAPGAGGRTVRYEKHVDHDHYLDLFAVDPAHHLRLPASTFNFALTGLDVKPTSILNLAEFLTHFAARCERAFLDPGIRFVLDGNPQTNLRFRSPEEYESYLTWRVQVLYHPGE